MERYIEVLFCHLLGDYVLQTGYIAETKGENWWHLVVHCLLYLLPFYFHFSVGWQLCVTLATHFLIDAAKARYKMIAYAWDQILHIALLFICYL